MKKIYAYAIPCTFTAANLFCGFVSIQFIITKDYVWAAWYIFFGMIFDIMDGRIARMTSGTSMFGAEFDSLADMVTFGVAPALLVYYRFMEASGIAGIVVAFIFILCGALRLARFNIMPHRPYFTGLPIPGGAAFGASLVLFGVIHDIDGYVNTITFMMFMTALLMVSTIPYPALKKGSKSKPPIFRRVLTQIGFWLIIAAAYVVSIEKAIFFAIVSYMASGIFYYAYRKIAKVSDVEENGENEKKETK